MQSRIESADDELRALLELALLGGIWGGEIDLAAGKDDVSIEHVESRSIGRRAVDRIGPNHDARLIAHATDGRGRDHGHPGLAQALREIRFDLLLWYRSWPGIGSEADLHDQPKRRR